MPLFHIHGIMAGLLFLVTAVWWMRRARSPLFDLGVFATRTFRATATGGFIYRLTISAVPFLLPLMFQNGFGWDPLHAGVLVAAVFIGNIGIKPATTPLIRRFGFKPVLVFASLASAATFALCALLDAGTPEPLIFALLVASGAFRSIGFSAYASVQYADVGPAGGPAVVLLHGWPYDIHTYEEVTPRLAAAGYRVIVPRETVRQPSRRSRNSARVVCTLRLTIEKAGLL